MINTSKSPRILLGRVAPLALLLLASANLYAQHPKGEIRAQLLGEPMTLAH